MTNKQCGLLSPANERSEWAEILFSFDVCLCVSVPSGTVNQISLKRLKLWTSNSTSMLQGQSDMTLKNFSKNGHGQGHVTPKFLGVKC